MPPGKYIRTPEICKRNSESMIGNTPYNKGKKGLCSPETIAKMKANRNDGRVTGVYVRTPEIRQKNHDSVMNRLPDSENTIKKKSESHKGMVYTEERNKKVSESLKDKPKSEEQKRKQSITMSLLPRDEEWCKHIGDSKRGSKHFNWQGGKSFEPYGLEFNDELREKIRIRDGYQCQECFKFQNELRTKSGRKYLLMIHHIDYDKGNNNLDNLITLCRICHAKTNYKRKDWENYFKERLFLKGLPGMVLSGQKPDCSILE